MRIRRLDPTSHQFIGGHDRSWHLRDMASSSGDQRLAAQRPAPTWKPRGAAILIESKDDIRERLCSSTDDADAVILAWHRRADAMVRRQPGLAPVEVDAGPYGWMT